MARSRPEAGAGEGPWLSVVVPTLDEAESIETSAPGWRRLREQGCEVILVDGGSGDDTVALARPRVDRVLVSAPGRAAQMNAGAAVARGRALLFLHVDTLLPEDAARSVRSALEGREWGRFDVIIDAPGIAFRVIERMMSWRSRLTAIATGDQAIFVTRDAFRAVGCYPDVELMEDIALSAALRRRGRPACLADRVRTSARRWQRNGVVRTVLLMWRLRMAYALGAKPADLARTYQS